MLPKELYSRWYNISFRLDYVRRFRLVALVLGNEYDSDWFCLN